MSYVPVEIVVGVFKDEGGADAALKELRAVGSHWLVDYEDAAVVRRDALNRLHIKETGEIGAGTGAAFGGVLGGVIGLIAGPAGVIVGAGAGALVGGAAAKRADTGIQDERLERIGATLGPGTSAIVAIVQVAHVDTAAKDLAAQGADVSVESLSTDLAQQLNDKHTTADTVSKADKDAPAVSDGISGTDADRKTGQ